MDISLKRAGAAYIVLLSALLFAIGLLLYRVEVQRLQQEEISRVDAVLRQVTNTLQNRIYENIHKVSVVKPLVAMNPALTQEDFSRAMSVRFDGRGDFRNIGLARDMVLKYVYPVEGNEAVVGLHYRSLPEQLPAVYLAKSLNEIVMAGPLKLVQGGRGWIARIPIFLPDAAGGEEQFWGFASVVMDSDFILEQAGFSEDNSGMRLAIRGRDGLGDQGEVFWGNAAVFESDPLTETINLPHGSWQIGALPAAGWHARPAGFTPLLLAHGGGSAVLLFFAGWIVFLLVRERHHMETLKRERDIYAEGPVWHMEWEAEPSGNWTLCYVSSNVRQTMGYGPDELLKPEFSFQEIIHPEDREEVLEHLKTSIREHRDRFGERYRIYTKGGSFIWVYDYSVLLRDSRGTVTGIRSYFYDQTAWIEAEEALRIAEQRLEKTAYELTENIPVGTYTMVQPPEGGIGKFCFMSSRFLELTGLTREAAERDPLKGFACVHPDDYDRWLALNAEAFEKKQAFFGETRVVVNGETRWITAESKPRALPDGSTVWEGALTDITEIKRTAQALQESLDRFNDLVSYVSVGVYVLWTRANGAMDCEYVSDGWCALTGLSREAVMTDWGAAIQSVHPEEREAFIALHQEVIAERKPFVWEGRVLRNGGWYYARIQSNPVFFENGDIRWFGVHQDISEQRKIEEALIAAGKRAEESSVAKGRFVATMSHELRTPLNGVIGFSELLADTELSEQQQQFLNYIQVCSKTLLSLISDVLDFSKIEAGMMELESIRTDLQEIYHDCLKVVRIEAEQKGLDLRLEVAANCPPCAAVDPTRLKQILINLLGNAVKFTESGEVVLEIRYQAEAEDRGRLRFSVRDTGIGISEAEQRNLFKAFSQADSSTTRRFGGTGLGLTISSMLAARMGDGLRVESRPGAGSVFHFDVAISPASLPESADTEASPTNTRPVSSASAVQEPRILIAEDNPINRQLLKILLEKRIAGARIREAINGAEAVALCRQEIPDLLFVDVQMPEMDGLDATREIRAMGESGKRLPIVVLTAGATSEEQELALSAGVDDYLSKPLRVEQLDRLIQKYLKRV